MQIIKCRKRWVDKLVQESTENIDEVKITETILCYVKRFFQR